MKKKIPYYTLDKILACGCQYNVIIGERSNGKTYSVLLHGLEEYCKSGYKNAMAIIRRWRDDFREQRGETLFNAIVRDNHIERLTNGQYSTVYHYSRRWYLANWDEKLQKMIPAPEPFAYGFAISTQEHDKSNSYTNITTVFFDEFLTRDSYLQDEFVKFQNLLSTIIRERDDATIFMCGNTVNRYSPYFTEMGLTNIKNQMKNTIDIYSYGETNLKVAVEYCDSISKYKPSNVYFAFDNPKLQMITDGEWEIDIYPHLPVEYTPSDVLFRYFILFDSQMLECEIIQVDNKNFTYVHAKTTPLRNPDEDLIFSLKPDVRPNWKRGFSDHSLIVQKIYRYFREDRVYYQNNEIGEVIRNFLNNI